MSKMTIEISPEAHAVLKEWIKKDCRSMNKYITVLLDNLTGTHPREMYLPVDITHNPETITIPGMQFIPHDTPGEMQTPEDKDNI